MILLADIVYFVMLFQFSFQDEDLKEELDVRLEHAISLMFHIE